MTSWHSSDSSDQCCDQNHEFLYMHLDNLPLAVVEWNADFRVIRWSGQAEKMFGWTKADVMGLDSSELALFFVHPDDREPLAKDIVGFLEGKKTRLFARQRNLTKHGTIVESEWHVSAQMDERGQLVSVLSFAHDVTELREAKRQNHHLKERMTQSLNNMSDAFYLLDNDWRFVYLNKEAQRILQHSAQQLLGQPVFDFFPDMLDSVLYQEYRETQRTRQPRQFELYYPPFNNWFEVNTFPSEEGIGVYFRTITARKELAQRLEESEERLRFLSQATVDAIRDWNLETDTVWWNDGIKSLFGYDVQEVEPGVDSWINRLHAADREKTVQALRRSIADPLQTAWGGQYRFLCKDGSVATVEDRVTIVRDKAGRALRIVGGMTDVTEKRALEKKMRESQRMEAIGQLTGGLAHDFNNLLTVVLGNTHLLTQALEADSPLMAPVKAVGFAAKRGTELTQRLVAFSRKQLLSPKSTEINPLIERLLELLRHTFWENIQLSFYPGEDVWPVMIDASQLDNSLLNLCLNARDAMPNGGQLTLETSNVQLSREYAAQNIDLVAGDYVCVAVTDTGCGIREINRLRIFEPFFSTKEKGTGLGLSMVLGFMNQSGGQVKVYSERGEGATFKLYLPRAASAVSPALPKDQAPEVLKGTEVILVVEDDAFVRDLVMSQIREAGYNVLQAGNGPEALSLLQSEHHVDLLFTDVMMAGGMNGRELAEAAQTLRPGLAVLFTSGYSQHAIIEHGRLDAGIEFIGKPYAPVTLLRKVRQILDARDGDH